MEYLIDWGRVYPPYYRWVGPEAPLGRSRAVLRAVVVVCIWSPLYIKPLHTVASGG